MCGRTKSTDELPRLLPADIEQLKLVIPGARVMNDLDEEVRNTFESAVEVLRAAGANIREHSLPILDDCDDLFLERPLVVREAWDFHRDMLEQHFDEYDPFVGARLRLGADISDAEQQSRIEARGQVVNAFEREFAELQVDALLYPTVVCIPPQIAETEDEENARRVNMRCLRNTATVNYFNGCAISLPCHQKDEAPVGLMLSAASGQDESLYRIAAAIEAALGR
jgi:aspartyl-tRNA(Asn)/glutamyl-tRNA(Gln) amidotransferase subunit A